MGGELEQKLHGVCFILNFFTIDYLMGLAIVRLLDQSFFLPLLMLIIDCYGNLQDASRP
jgi:hypothetical protein